jgi:hypothetical protein
MCHPMTVINSLIPDKIQSHNGDHHDDDKNLEAFMVTGINKIFSGRQLCQFVKSSPIL